MFKLTVLFSSHFAKYELLFVELIKHGQFPTQNCFCAVCEMLYNSSTKVVLDPCLQSSLKIVSGPTKKKIVAPMKRAKKTKTPSR